VRGDLEIDGRAVAPHAPEPIRDTGQLSWPVVGVIESGFGTRVHPILGTVRVHDGIDINVAPGTAILAPTAGTVLRAGDEGDYGNSITIDHGAGLRTRYCHLSRIDVTVGQCVVPGATIGLVGSTGLSTGPHLHFEVSVDGQLVDPLDVLLPRDDLETLWGYLAPRTREQPSDVIFCFGSRSPGIAHHAAALYERRVAPMIIVSGGARGRVEPYATEAAWYVEILRGAGVPDECIVVEERARHTGENVSFGMEAARAHGLEVRSATLVSLPTMLRRCRATFRLQFPDVVTHPQPPYHLHDHTRAHAMRTALRELERLRTYPDAGFIAPEPIPEHVDRAAARLAHGTLADAHGHGSFADVGA
jgi:hypothetical protein